MLLILSYTIYNKITLWHDTKNKMDYFNKFVLITFLCSVSLAIYVNHKQKALEEAEFKERYKKEKQQEDCAKEGKSEKEQDAFTEFLLEKKDCYSK